MKTYLLIIISLLYLGATSQVCPTTADHVQPVVYPTPLILGNGDTLLITSDYSVSGELTVQNGGVVIVCNDAIFTFDGSISVHNRGLIVFTGCGELRVEGSYSGDWKDCELESWCGDCGNLGYYPLVITFGVKAWDGLCCKKPLPIELISFTAKQQNDNNTISWVTGVEINNDYFTIERSIDILSWASVHYRDGTNTAYIRSYSFVDHNITQSYYYRLGQTDYDGTVAYSGILFIGRESGNVREVYRTNVLGQIVNKSYVGIVFIVYSNGEKKRTFQN